MPDKVPNSGKSSEGRGTSKVPNCQQKSSKAEKGKRKKSPSNNTARNRYSNYEPELYSKSNVVESKGSFNKTGGQKDTRKDIAKVRDQKIPEDKGVTRRDESLTKTNKKGIPMTQKNQVKDPEHTKNINPESSKYRFSMAGPAPSSFRDDARLKAAEAAISRSDFSKALGFAKANNSSASTDQMAVQSVLFVCPVVSNEVLPLKHWKSKIINYITDLSKTEKGVSVVLKIHTLNSNKEKIDECIQILTTYIKNVLTNLEDDKYRSIKKTNKVFVEKVLPISGAMEFLEAAGFRKMTKISAENEKLEVLYLSGEPDTSNLETLIDAIRTAEPLLPQVYRNPIVLKPQEAEEKIYLPDDFFDLTEQELTDMYKKNIKRAEEETPLMTKALREKEERRRFAKYKYSLLRIRFPDTMLLQGTFARYDTQKSIKDFIDSSLIRSIQYSLYCPMTKKVLSKSDDNKTLCDLKLIPAVILNFIPEDKDKFPKVYLKPDLLSKIKKI